MQVCMNKKIYFKVVYDWMINDTPAQQNLVYWVWNKGLSQSETQIPTDAVKIILVSSVPHSY